MLIILLVLIICLHCELIVHLGCFAFASLECVTTDTFIDILELIPIFHNTNCAHNLYTSQRIERKCNHQEHEGAYDPTILNYLFKYILLLVVGRQQALTRCWLPRIIVKSSPEHNIPSLSQDLLISEHKSEGKVSETSEKHLCLDFFKDCYVSKD